MSNLFDNKAAPRVGLTLFETDVISAILAFCSLVKRDNPISVKALAQEILNKYAVSRRKIVMELIDSFKDAEISPSSIGEIENIYNSTKSNPPEIPELTSEKVPAIKERETVSTMPDIVEAIKNIYRINEEALSGEGFIQVYSEQAKGSKIRFLRPKVVIFGIFRGLISPKWVETTDRQGTAQIRFEITENTTFEDLRQIEIDLRTSMVEKLSVGIAIGALKRLLSESRHDVIYKDRALLISQVMQLLEVYPEKNKFVICYISDRQNSKNIIIPLVDIEGGGDIGNSPEDARQSASGATSAFGSARLSPEAELDNLLTRVSEAFSQGEGVEMTVDELRKHIVSTTADDPFRVASGDPIAIVSDGGIFKERTELAERYGRPLRIVFTGQGEIRDKSLFKVRGQGVLDECAWLAKSMQIKNAIFEIPYSGKKTTFVIDGKNWMSVSVLFGNEKRMALDRVIGKGGDRAKRLSAATTTQDVADAFRKHARAETIARILGFYILDGPDMVTDVDRMMSIIVDSHNEAVDEINAFAVKHNLKELMIDKRELLRPTTSESIDKGSFPHKQWMVTSYGVVQGMVSALRFLMSDRVQSAPPVLKRFITDLNLKRGDISVLIPGFGDVGSGKAKLLVGSEGYKDRADYKDMPEYADGLKKGAGPRILIGDPNKKAGKIFVDMTGAPEAIASSTGSPKPS